MQRALHSLAADGWVRPVEVSTTKWVIDPGVRVPVRGRGDVLRSLTTAARPAMQILAEKLGTDIHLAVLDGVQLRMVAHVRTVGATPTLLPAEHVRPLHSTSLGKALLAAMAPECATSY